jgi:DNA-binding Xre family transcriptional regulator
MTKTPPSKVRIMVPEIIKARGITPWSIVRKAGLAPGTAYRYCDPVKAAKITRFESEVLTALCDYLQVPLSEIIQYDPNSVDSG